MQKLRLVIWELYVGRGVTDGFCPLCDTVRIFRNHTTGFEAAHVVANRFYSDAQMLQSTDLYPSCSSCNNECRDQCLFDYLYCRERYKQLRRMIWALYTNVQESGNNPENLHIWQVMRKWYGTERFPLGGGIKNTQMVYEIARNVELTHLLKEASELNAKSAENAKKTQQLLECTIY